MLISFRSGWRLPRTYGFFFRIYCNPPSQGSSRTYNTKPEFCLSKSIVKSKFNDRKQPRVSVSRQNWEHSGFEAKSKKRSEGTEKKSIKEYPNEKRYIYLVSNYDLPLHQFDHLLSDAGLIKVPENLKVSAWKH